MLRSAGCVIEGPPTMRRWSLTLGRDLRAARCWAKRSLWDWGTEGRNLKRTCGGLVWGFGWVGGWVLGCLRGGRGDGWGGYLPMWMTVMVGGCWFVGVLWCEAIRCMFPSR